MARIHPQSLGNAYPALCNFLKLSALTLGVQQLALTVQVGADPRNTGVLSYGHTTQVVLRQMLEQPHDTLAAVNNILSIGTIYRQLPPSPDGQPSPATASAALVGRMHPPKSSYYLTLYVPGLMAETLTPVQVKTLAYLSQQLVMCLLAVPLPAHLVPPPLPPSLGDDYNTPSDFLARVVSINPVHAIVEHQLHSHPHRLVDLVTNLQACLSYKQLGHLLAKHLPPFFPHRAGRLVLLSGHPPSFTVLTGWGDDQPLQTLDHHCCFLADDALAKGPGTCKNCHQCDSATQSHGMSTCLVLGTLNQVTCLLQLTQPDGASFNLSQTALLQKLSEQILFVMQRLLLLEDLQDQALKDPLTGLMNRRSMEKMLTNLCCSTNQQQQVSLILIDLDHFKAVNDTYGHPAGDVVLQTIGIVLKGHVRSRDIVCRYGGEEFSMVLLDTPLDVALQRAEKIRRAVKYLTPVYADQTIESLTISLGVACFPDHGQTSEQLIQAADQALYWAKNHGRDRTISADQMLAAALGPPS